MAGSELFSRDHQMKVFVSTVEHQESTCALSHGMQLSSILIPSILLPLGLISMAEFIKCGIWWGEGNWDLLTNVDLGLILLYQPRVDSQASFPGEIVIVTPFIASLLRSYWLKTRVSSVLDLKLRWETACLLSNPISRFAMCTLRQSRIHRIVG